MTLETAQTYMNTVSFVHPCIHEIFDTGWCDSRPLGADMRSKKAALLNANQLGGSFYRIH